MEDLRGFFWKGDIDNYYFGHQFEEIFKTGIYDPYVKGKKDLTIIDCGAHVGVFSLYAQKYAKVVYALEPAQEHYSVLSHMLVHNHFTNVLPFNVALANKDGEATFYHLPNKTMYSLTPAAIDPTLQHETVKTIRLDTFFSQHNINHVDVFKIDCEGEEYNILCGDGFANVADKIDVVIGETHSWANRHPNQLKEAFKNNGFSFESIPGDAQLFVAKRK